MSMVGPRPERREFIEDYSRIIPEFRERLRVKGGLTDMHRSTENTVPGLKTSLSTI